MIERENEKGAASLDVTRRAVRVVAAVTVVVVALSGYGYWHTVTHADLQIYTRDASGADLELADAELVFVDTPGNVLAQYTSDAGVFYVSAPAPYVCHDIEKRAAFEVGGREAYRECWKRQSRWTRRGLTMRATLACVSERAGGTSHRCLPPRIAADSGSGSGG